MKRKIKAKIDEQRKSVRTRRRSKWEKPENRSLTNATGIRSKFLPGEQEQIPDPSERSTEEQCGAEIANHVHLNERKRGDERRHSPRSNLK